MTYAEKQELFDMANLFVNMTLNGEPAKIIGRKLSFPIVARIHDSLQAEYTWEAVKHIVSKGGDFET